jgi:outer membrane protein assembly factor BamB
LNAALGFALLLAAADTRAGADAPAPVPGPAGAVVRWRIDLKVEKPAAGPLTWWLIAVGDRVTAAWCHDRFPGAKEGGPAFLFDPSGLTARPDGVTGTLSVRVRDRSFKPHTAARDLKLEVAAKDGRMTGTVVGTVRLIGKEADFAAAVTGGEAVRDLAKSNAVDPNLAWPGWTGPNQNFSATRTDTPVTADPGTARLVWKSEYVGPTEMGSMRYGLCAGHLPAEGGASPVVANGRVFQFRVVPSGDAHHEKHLNAKGTPEALEKVAALGLTDADLKKTWAIDADEQVLCLDASTGRTLWATTFPGTGIHLYDHKCALTNHTGYATADRVFAFGSLGVVRCLDAATGKPLWETPVPGYAGPMAKMKQDWLARPEYPQQRTRSFCHALAFADGVLLAPTGPNACGVAGLAADTGKILWKTAEPVLGGGASPVTWNGLAVCLGMPARDGVGVLTAFDLKTGDKKWTAGGLGSNDYHPALAGDVLIVNGATNGKSEPGRPETLQTHGRMAGYRLTPTGAERLWIAPEKSGQTWYRATAAVDGNLAAVRVGRTLRLVDVATGEVRSTAELPTGREDETHTSAMNGVFYPEMDSQHGLTGFYGLSAAGKLAPLWHPPHPHTTTYHVPMSHAWVDGRLFVRGGDGVYCYDLRTK